MSAKVRARETRIAILEYCQQRQARAQGLATLLGLPRSTVRLHLDDLVEEGLLERNAGWYALPKDDAPDTGPVTEAPARVRYDRTRTSITPEQAFLGQLLLGAKPAARDVPEALLRAGSVVVENGVAKLTKDGRELARLVPGCHAR